MQMLGAADHVVTLGAGYLRILFLGSIVTMLNFGISALLLGVGRTDISLWVLMVVNLLNVGLNYVFIFGAGPVPALGVTGAAVGTVAARTLGAAAGLWIVCDRRFPIQARFRDGLVFDWTLFRRVMYLGGPRSLQGIVRNTSRLITIRIITLLPDSTRALSAYTVAMQVQMMSVFIGLGFMSAAMARVGQNLGAGDPDSAERSGWISAVLAALLMGVVALVLLLLPTAIMGFFTGDREVIALGRTFFLIIAAIQPVMAVAFALGGALSGAGDPMSPFIYASVSDLLVVLVAGYLLAIPLGLGFTGVALGLALSGLTRTLPTVWKFRQGRWKVNRF
jgi:putative MATE family efflux protein